MLNRLELLALSILAVFAPVKTVLITTLILVAADFVTGIIASWRKGDAITSRGMKQSVVKAVLYEAAILLAYLAEHYLIGDSVPATKIITSLIGMTELLSCIENLNRINGSPVFSLIINKLNQNLQPGEAIEKKDES
jgi:phage-related holin